MKDNRLSVPYLTVICIHVKAFQCEGQILCWRAFSGPRVGVCTPAEEQEVRNGLMCLTVSHPPLVAVFSQCIHLQS